MHIVKTRLQNASLLFSMQKPLILVTNDDGITAPGIRYLIDIMKELGEVVVVAPDSPQSGKGHAVTLDTLCTATLCPHITELLANTLVVVHLPTV